MAPELNAHPDCTRCTLHSSCQSIGIATEAYRVSRQLKDSALLVIGEAPGGREDMEGRPFVGPSGTLLRKVYLDGMRLPQLTDCYLTNVVRCRPINNAKPTAKQQQACAAHLATDIAELQTHYKTIRILAVGATAASALTGQQLKAAMQEPGQLESHGLPCWTTYHPAAILRSSRSGARTSGSALITAVEDHLHLLKRHIRGIKETAVEPHILLNPRGPFHIPRTELLSLDIETYGCLRSKQQNYFHPELSVRKDGIDPNDLIVSVALSTSPSVDEPTVVLTGDHPDMYANLFARLAGATCIIGFNLVFDLTYVCRVFPRIHSLIRNRYLDGVLDFIDVQILNALDSEARPERALKSIGKLLGYAASKSGLDFDGPQDPELHRYNAKDTLLALMEYTRLRDNMRERYGPNSAKLSVESRKWYSDLIFAVLEMTLAGCTFSRAALLDLQNKTQKKMKRLERRAARIIGAPIKGKGSNKTVEGIVRAASAKLTVPQLEQLPRTKVKGGFGRGKETLQLLSYFANDRRLTRQINCILEHRALRRLITGYTKPYLDRHCLDDGSAYPTWYIVRGQSRAGDEGGVIQGRIVPARPSTTTDPESIRGCMRSRFDGSLLTADLSQIEYRVAGLLSNDPVILRAFRMGKDIHRETARAIFSSSKVTAEQRAIGKRINFLVIYGGGASKLRIILFKLTGKRYKLQECQSWLDNYWREHPTLSAWKRGLVAQAKRQGYLEVPIIGQSRMFLGTNRQIEDDAPAIANVLVQAVAADILISGQVHIQKALLRKRMTSVIIMNKYDSLTLDCPEDEVPRAKRLLKILRNPPFYRQLCASLQRSVPLDYTTTERKS